MSSMTKAVEQWQADGVLRAVCGGVIMTSASNSNALVARDAATGAERWDRSGDVVGCDRARIIIVSDNEVVAVDAAHGHQAWATDMGGAHALHQSAHDEGLLVRRTRQRAASGVRPVPLVPLYR